MLMPGIQEKTTCGVYTLEQGSAIDGPWIKFSPPPIFIVFYNTGMCYKKNSFVYFQCCFYGKGVAWSNNNTHCMAHKPYDMYYPAISRKSWLILTLEGKQTMKQICTDMKSITKKYRVLWKYLRVWRWHLTKSDVTNTWVTGHHTGLVSPAFKCLYPHSVRS